MESPVWKFIRERWFTVDSRALGLFRIAFGILLLTNLYDRTGGWDGVTFYTNEGVLPNHYALFAPPAKGIWGLMFGFNTVGEVRFFLFFVYAIYFTFLLGYRTKLMQILVLICVESVNWRFLLIQHGGNVVMNILAVWSIFLPLGDRFSIDSLLRSMRSHKETKADELNAKSWLPSLPQSHVGLAFFFLCFNFAVIYFFNALHKTGGPGWSDGSGVHYVLWQNRMATHLCEWVRMHEPFWLSPALTYGTLIIEWALPVTILSLWWQRWTRLFSWTQIWCLHGGIALLSTLGPFSYGMMTFGAILITPQDMAWIRAFLATRTKIREVRFDVNRPLNLLAARVLARMDGLDRLKFVDADGSQPFAARIQGQTEWKEGSAAMASALMALPFGFLIAWPFAIIFVADLLKAVVRLLARLHLELFKDAPVKPEGPVWRAGRLAVQIVLPIFLFITVCSQILMENWGVPQALKVRTRPEIFTTTIEYLQIPQGWSMFAPDVPRDDASMVVDAVLSDGSHIDPLTGNPPDFEPQRPFFYSQHWCEWHARLRNWPHHFRNFKEYLFRIPRLQNWPPEKQIVSFDVYFITSQVPKPGEPPRLHTFTRQKLFDSSVQ